MTLQTEGRLIIERLLSVQRTGQQRRLAILVACSKAKGKVPAKASELYTSHIFRGSVSISTQLDCSYYILSAKYGLLGPKCVIPPYDAFLGDFSPHENEAWGNEVASVLKRICAPDMEIIFLASKKYSSSILKSLNGFFSQTHLPLNGLSIGRMGEWVSAAQHAIERQKLIRAFYSSAKLLADKQGFPTLRQLLESDNIPLQGIYFFFDETESTGLANEMPRLVRIGTHAVSEGSKATLRTRLRTHLGTKAGDGNHRGSIFRLHVGAALMKKSGTEAQLSTWGKGQTAQKAVRVNEQSMEQEVSAYLAGLRVLCLPLSGPSERNNIRSTIERNTIALFTEGNICPDRPTANWLGNWSPRDEIRLSGLWNLQHLGSACDFGVVRKTLQLVDRRGELPLQ